MAIVLLLMLLPATGCVSYKRFCFQEQPVSLQIQDRTTGHPLLDCVVIQTSCVGLKDLTWPMGEGGTLVHRYNRMTNDAPAIRIPRVIHRFWVCDFFFFSRIPDTQSSRYEVFIYKPGYEVVMWTPEMPQTIGMLPFDRKDSRCLASLGGKQEQALCRLADVLLPGLGVSDSEDQFRFCHEHGKGKKRWRARGSVERRQMKENMAFLLGEYKKSQASSGDRQGEFRKRMADMISRLEYLNSL